MDLFNEYLLLVTFETNDNYLIQFKILNYSSTIGFDMIRNENKKLSYCWETVRHESMPRIAEMDVEMTT